MHRDKLLHGILTAASVGVLTFLFFVQAKVVLEPIPIRLLPTQVAYGYASTHSSLCTSISGYWKFDEGSGTQAKDSSQLGAHATVHGSPTWTGSTATPIAFENDFALTFDGSNDYTDVDLSGGPQPGLALSTTGSVAGFFKVEQIPHSKALYVAGSDTGTTIGHGLYVSHRSTGAVFSFFIDDDGAWPPDLQVNTHVVATGSWHHVAGTWDTSGIRIFHSGSLVATSSGTITADTLLVDAYRIGGNVTGFQSSGYFDGVIDDLRVYKATLSGGQVLDLARGNHLLLGCTCGDGVKQSPEACDDGNTSNIDACLNTCVAASCGDGFVRSGSEECDSGGSNSDTTADACRTTCKNASCGDSVADAGEACDDGNGNNLTDSCTDLCKAPSCGDNYVQESQGETCEPPNSGTCSSICTAAGGGGGTSNRRNKRTTSSAGSTASYEKREPPPEGCGNHIFEPELGEECDAGQWNGAGVCSYNCKRLFCGDGIVSPEKNEHCEPEQTGEDEDGNPLYEQETCSDDEVTCSVPDIDERTGVWRGGCQFLFVPRCEERVDGGGERRESAVCGNGLVELGEACDDGNTAPGDGCSAVCLIEEMAEKPAAPECGNGSVEIGEQCDDGNGTSGDGCSASCRREQVQVLRVAECGNARVEPGEQCDDGNAVSGDGCTAACREELPVEEPQQPQLEREREREPQCGDGVVEGKEQCDGGSANSNIRPDACRLNCQLPFCGDGVRDSAEECDAEAGCGLGCRWRAPVCGNGVLESGESCDDGNRDGGDGCSGTCSREEEERVMVVASPVCGNGLLEDSELCDDGNTADGDGCSALCVLEELSAPELRVDLTVQITDQEDRPYAGVPVTLYSEPMRAVTDGEGIARFSDVALGKHRLEIGDPSSDFRREARLELVSVDDQFIEVTVRGDGVQERRQRVDIPDAGEGAAVATAVEALLQVVIPVPEPKPVAPPPPIVAQLVPPPAWVPRPPVGETGPAAIAFVALGSALGVAWQRRRKK